MKELALRLKGKPAILESSITEAEEFKNSIKKQFLQIDGVVKSFRSNFCENEDAIRIDINFFIPTKNIRTDLTDSHNLFDMVEHLKCAALQAVEIEERFLSDVSIIKRPSNNGNFEMFIRLRRVKTGELNERRNSGKKRLHKAFKRDGENSGNEYSSSRGNREDSGFY